MDDADEPTDHLPAAAAPAPVGPVAGVAGAELMFDTPFGRFI